MDYYDLQAGEFGHEVTGTFMAPVDDHSREIEQQLSQIEAPAARAVTALLERMIGLKPGLYALADETSTDAAEALQEAFVAEGMLLLQANRTVARPSPADESALAAFLGLMYSRSPKQEDAIRRSYETVIAGVQYGMHRMNAGDVAFTEDTKAKIVNDSRWFGLRHADDIASTLRSRLWWLLKSGPEEQFIIGDSPVVAGIAIGHDSDWMALADPSAVVAFPLSPEVALLISGPIIPLATEADKLVAWVNRTALRWADRYVAAQDRATIETALDANLESLAEVELPVDRETWFGGGAAAVIEAILLAEVDTQFKWRELYPRTCANRPNWVRVVIRRHMLSDA